MPCEGSSAGARQFLISQKLIPNDFAASATSRIRRAAMSSHSALMAMPALRRRLHLVTLHFAFRGVRVFCHFSLFAMPIFEYRLCETRSARG